MRFSRIPDYSKWTFDDRGDGFFFTNAPPADIAAPKHLRDGNPWVVLACALARLQGGDFGVFPAVVDAMAAEREQSLWVSAGTLFAFAAPSSALDLIDRLYTPDELGRSPEMVRQYAKILCRALDTARLDEVSALYGGTGDEDVRVLVSEYLSHVWEDEPGMVAA